MSGQRKSSGNAIKHGIFAQSAPVVARSPFARFAIDHLPGPAEDEVAAEISTAERQSGRCHVALQAQYTEIDALLDAPEILLDDRMRRVAAELRKLNRLLRYQGDSLNHLRRARIEILNAAEGLGDWPRQGKV